MRVSVLLSVDLAPCFRRAMLFGVLVCVALGLFAGAAGSAVAAPAGAPAWTIAVVPYPTAFVAGSVSGSEEKGPAYQIDVFNVGGGATEGEFKIVDTLPGPLKPVAGFPPSGVYGPERTSEQTERMSCSVVGHTVTCTGGQEAPLGPGEQAAVSIPVEVEASAPSQTLDKALVEGGGAATVAASQPTVISAEASPFGLLGALFGSVTNADGSAATQAGSHPYQATVAGFYVNSNADAPGIDDLLAPGGGLHEVAVGLPRGEIVNPQATPHCTEGQLYDSEDGSCPEDTQVGTVALTLGLIGGFGEWAAMKPLYNMVSPPRHPAEFAFEVIPGVYVHLLGALRADGGYHLAAASSDISAIKEIGGVRVALWGDPSAESHDDQRGECLLAISKRSLCPLGARSHEAFLTMPSSCEGPVTTTAQLDDWLEPGNFISGSYASTDLEGHEVSIEGCNALEFKPTISAQPTSEVADSSTGLEFDLHQPQDEDDEGLATASLKNARVTLPAGLTVNAAAANGLGACSPEQIGLASAVGDPRAQFTEAPQSCPDAAKLGTLEVSTPLLDHKLQGSIYLAEPHQNPFGSLLSIYLAVEDEDTGIIVKLAGKVEADPASGQLTATFTENPELPVEDIELHFFAGETAALSTPLTCGAYTTTSDLTPWSTPEGADAMPSSSPFTVAGAPGGAACVSSEAQAPNAPVFEAGTASPIAASYSPFVLRLKREDGSQRFSSLNVTLPPGLLGNVAGLTQCSQAAIEAAQARDHEGEGVSELERPSCPAGSEVGSVHVGAGSGAPYFVTGHAYFAGPYNGAPFSLVIITPAVAGPFDLGAVVVRAGLYINRDTAQVTVKSDAFPTILDGIPLDIRSISVDISRKEFVLNPTSCSATSVTGQESSTTGQAVALSNRFQVGGCANLPFKPGFSASAPGRNSKAGGAGLKLVGTSQPGSEADVAKLDLTIPLQLPARLTTLQKACTAAVFEANPAGCPQASDIGTMIVHTPLLSVPATGPIYLVSHGGEAFPDTEVVLQADERGGDIEIVLDGKTDIKNGVTYSDFETVPDVPFTSFEATLPQGPHSIFGTNLPASDHYSLCGQNLTIPTTLAGQNGVVLKQKTKLAISGCPTTLSITSHHIKKRTLTLSIYAPAAGKIKITGKGLHAKTLTVKGTETLTIKIKQKHAGKRKNKQKAGKRKTKITVLFTPNAGKKQSKVFSVKLKR
ncbi:MAG: hypothetical protein ACRDK7_12985 [Solirubrobacteraceae bacterium]